MLFCNLGVQNDVEIKVYRHSKINIVIRKLTYKTKSFEPRGLNGQKDQALPSPCGIWNHSFSRINLNVIQYAINCSGFFTP